MEEGFIDGAFSLTKGGIVLTSNKKMSLRRGLTSLAKKLNVEVDTLQRIDLKLPAPGRFLANRFPAGEVTGDDFRFMLGEMYTLQAIKVVLKKSVVAKKNHVIQSLSVVQCVNKGVVDIGNAERIKHSKDLLIEQMEADRFAALPDLLDPVSLLFQKHTKNRDRKTVPVPDTEYRVDFVPIPQCVDDMA